MFFVIIKGYFNISDYRILSNFFKKKDDSILSIRSLNYKKLLEIFVKIFFVNNGELYEFKGSRTFLRAVFLIR